MNQLLPLAGRNLRMRVCQRLQIPTVCRVPVGPKIHRPSSVPPSERVTEMHITRFETDRPQTSKLSLFTFVATLIAGASRDSCESCDHVSRFARFAKFAQRE